MRTLRILLLTALGLSPTACLEGSPADEALSDDVATGEASQHAVLGPVVVCIGTETATYAPGLLLPPQVVLSTSQALLGPCISTEPTLLSGVAVTTGTPRRSCLDLGVAGTGTTTITWSNGQVSTFDFNSITTDILGSSMTISTGIIGTGPFAGRAAVETTQAITINMLACLAPPGLTSTISTASFTIL